MKITMVMTAREPNVRSVYEEWDQIWPKRGQDWWKEKEHIKLTAMAQRRVARQVKARHSQMSSPNGCAHGQKSI